MKKETTFDAMKATVQRISFAFSCFSNIILILLICTNSPKKIGSYKYLMIYFCVFAIFFSVLDIVIQPYILSAGPGFIVITEIKDTFLGPFGETCFLSSICGCFGVILATIAIHFIYRYFALERKGKLKYFQGGYLVVWLFVPLFVGTVWTIVTVYFCAPNDITLEYSRTLMKDHYEIDLENVTYIGSIYFVKDANGKSVMNKFALLGMAILFSIMGVSLSILAYFATKCYTRIKKLIYEGESSYTRNLQKQLYKALVAQASIPMFFIFTPIGLYLTLPLVGIELEISGEIATFVYALYPALDPLPIIFIIHNYRDAVLEFLGCCNVNNRIGAEDEPTSVTRHVSNCS
ncbi:Serpentine receptor class r-10 [Caenorhabditis elegans]|uniref:Serpentine receptor class r-10 n=1 Tax=Caenorhabditis elegans TaxID=6239 RepID=Q9N2S7_CAEEL|nr:Seven TM Receptor [Caenorhabditis elegans]CCD68686.1 Seven TM Receptor [Caenorhabditis elegans]|eukprot:NP_500682.2 Seven TM Receptor [Caenorhabditis elegans]